MNPTRPPKLAYALGYLGLLPFVLCSAAVLLGWPFPTWWFAGLLVYSAAIASFLGGIHWGFAMQRHVAQAAGGAPAPAHAKQMLWGVTPTALAFFAALLKPGWNVVALSAVLLLCLWVDRKAYKEAGLAGWLPLRYQLTAVAVLCLAATAWRVWPR